MVAGDSVGSKDYISSVEVPNRNKMQEQVSRFMTHMPSNKKADDRKPDTNKTDLKRMQQLLKELLPKKQKQKSSVKNAEVVEIVKQKRKRPDLLTEGAADISSSPSNSP